MDLNLHTSIIVVAAILVLLIILDGVKRMLAARAEYQRLNTKPIAKDEALDLLKAELPNGGARSVYPPNIKSAEGLKHTSASNEVDETEQLNEASAHRKKSTQYAVESGFASHKGKPNVDSPVNKVQSSKDRVDDAPESLKASSSQITTNEMASNGESSSDDDIEVQGPVPMLMESIELEDDLTEDLAGITASAIQNTVKDDPILKGTASKSSVAEFSIKTPRPTEPSKPVEIAKREIPENTGSFHKSQKGCWGDVNSNDDVKLDAEILDSVTDTSCSEDESDSICATSSDRIAAGGIAFSSKPSQEALEQHNKVLNHEAETRDQVVNRNALNNSLNDNDSVNSNDCLKNHDYADRTHADRNSAFADIDPLFDEDFEQDEPKCVRPTKATHSKATTTQLKESVGERLADRPVSDEVLVMHVFSKDSTGFSLPKLFGLFKACDLRLGEMSIFHRFERANAQGKIQFSVADVVKPGMFDTEPPSGATTPGIALFLSLPGPDNPIEAYNTMAEVAQAVAKNLNGLIKDEMLSVMTAQTLEHDRQRVHEFIRRQQLLAKSSMA